MAGTLDMARGEILLLADVDQFEIALILDQPVGELPAVTWSSPFAMV